MKTIQLDPSTLELCDRTRVRKNKPNINSDIVEEYAEAYKCGLIVEPLDVFREKGTERYIVADGEHRLLAMQRAKIKAAECRLHDGDEVAALDFAIGCNHAHGVRRTKADKYHAFERIMETPLKQKYRNDTELSEKIGVSKGTIANYKVQWRNSESADRETRRKKQVALESAEKKTNKGLAPRTALNGTKQELAPKREAPKPKPAPKETDDGGWTKADEKSSADILDALHVLGEAWKAGTRPAQIHCADVIHKTVRDMR